MSVNQYWGQCDVDGYFRAVTAGQLEGQRAVHLSGRRVFAVLGTIGRVYGAKALGDQRLYLVSHQIGSAKTRKCLEVEVDVANPAVVVDNCDTVGQHLEQVSPRKGMIFGTARHDRVIDQVGPTFT